MKREDLIHTIDAIQPGPGLKAKVLALEGHSRPSLEHPLKHLMALGAAGLLCAGVVAAVLVLQSGMTPGGNAANPNLNSAAMQVTDTPTPTDMEATPALPTDAGLTPVTPKITLTQDVGVDMAFLDYASDNIVIFHGYFGLFVFDLESNKIIRSINLKPIGCAMTQGDDYCSVTVSADGSTVQLHPVSSKNMYVYNVSDNTLRETANEDMANRFTGFVDIEEAIGPQKSASSSACAARFDNGEYGYLHTSDWTLGTLTYIRGGKTIQLFENWSAPSETPQPTPADDSTNSASPNPSPYPTATPNDGDMGSKKALPDGIISPDQAVSIATQGFADYFGVNVGECRIVDGYSYAQITLPGSDAPIPDAVKASKKPVLIVSFSQASPETPGGSVGPYPLQWTIEYDAYGLGSRYAQNTDAQKTPKFLELDAASGTVIGGNLNLPGPTYHANTTADKQQQENAARLFVQQRILGQAHIVKVENTNTLPEDYLSVTLSDNRVILVWVSKDMKVVGFETTVKTN